VTANTRRPRSPAPYRATGGPSISSLCSRPWSWTSFLTARSRPVIGRLQRTCKPLPIRVPARCCPIAPANAIGRPPSPALRPGNRRRQGSEPRLAARQPLRLSRVDLTAIEGIEENTALVLLSEIGTDMSRWPNEKHFAAWLGLCPHPKISGGKVLARPVRPSA